MKPFPWSEAIGFGLGVLRLAPEAFWRMTPRELAHAVIAGARAYPVFPAAEEVWSDAPNGATALFVAYWGFRFGVLGVYISGRTREKLCAVTGQGAPGLVEKLVKAVKKKPG